MPTPKPAVCPICESRDIMVLTADSNRVVSVCKACFARFEIVPYKLPADGPHGPSNRSSLE